MTLITAKGKIIFGGDFLKFRVININRSFIVKSIIICLFLLYTLMIVDFTLISDGFGRSISNIFLTEKSEITKYLSEKINLIPFATINLFVAAWKNSILETHSVVENIWGNLLVFAPYAFFVPYIFKGVNTLFKFLIVISIAVLSIECLQIIFLTGSADIDDFLLNVSGAAMAYGLLNIKIIKNFINKILFGEANEIKG